MREFTAACRTMTFAEWSLQRRHWGSKFTNPVKMEAGEVNRDRFVYADFK